MNVIFIVLQFGFLMHEYEYMIRQMCTASTLAAAIPYSPSGLYSVVWFALVFSRLV